MSCPHWCTDDHAKPGASASVHVATVASGAGADGGRIGVSVGHYEGQVPLVFLQVYGQAAAAAPSWAQPLTFTAEDAVAFAAVLPVLGGPEWLAGALTAAADLLGHHSAANGASPTTDPATPVAR